MTPLEITTSTDSSSSGSDSISDSWSSTLVSPVAWALARARSSIDAVMSTPIARPDGPVIWAAMSRSVPAPHPRSSTISPGVTGPCCQGLATPAKLAALSSGTRPSAGSG